MLSPFVPPGKGTSGACVTGWHKGDRVQPGVPVLECCLPCLLLGSKWGVGRAVQLVRVGGWPCPAQPPPPPPGVFNPNSEDPLPGQLRKQLVLRIISGQQLPKPRDSMLGDRGEVGGPLGADGEGAAHPPGPGATLPSAQIIDPFVEVEVIGLPVDCSKEQTRVVDDNGEGVPAALTGQPVLTRHSCHAGREGKGARATS